MHITYRYPQQPAITFIVVSFFLVIAVFMPACVLCKHYAGGTCILHCALFNNYCTRLPSHQLHLHKCRKKLSVSFLLFYIIVFWPFDNFPNGNTWISCKGSVKQESWLSYFHCLQSTTLCFRKRKWRNLWNQSKIPLNTLK